MPSTKALVSLGCGPQERLLAISRSTFAPYAARHGYELHLHREADADGRPPAWAKVKILRDAVKRFELVLWIDADAMIVDGRIDIATQIPIDRMMGLVQHSVGEMTIPNTGVWVIRGGAEAIGLMDAIWEQDDLIEHRWWENAALCRLLGYDLPTMTLDRPSGLLLDQTHFLESSWNSIPDDPAPAPKIRHYPGYAVRTRRAFMTRDRIVTRARRAAHRW